MTPERNVLFTPAQQPGNFMCNTELPPPNFLRLRAKGPDRVVGSPWASSPTYGKFTQELLSALADYAQSYHQYNQARAAFRRARNAYAEDPACEGGCRKMLFLARDALNKVERDFRVLRHDVLRWKDSLPPAPGNTAIRQLEALVESGRDRFQTARDHMNLSYEQVKRDHWHSPTVAHRARLATHTPA